LFPTGRDALVVPKLDRLARSVPDARAIADELERRGVRLQLGTTVYDPRDPMGKMFFNILAVFAEFEADLLSLRTREGMAVARANGRLKGKPPKLSPNQQQHLLKLLRSGASFQPHQLVEPHASRQGCRRISRGLALATVRAADRGGQRGRILARLCLGDRVFLLAVPRPAAPPPRPGRQPLRPRLASRPASALRSSTDARISRSRGAKASQTACCAPSNKAINTLPCAPHAQLGGARSSTGSVT
jgi:hypothetical protein